MGGPSFTKLQADLEIPSTWDEVIGDDFNRFNFTVGLSNGHILNLLST